MVIRGFYVLRREKEGTDDMDMADNYNQDRVNRAELALADYGFKTEGDAAVIDLLTDLRHFCDARGYDLGNCDRIAHDHYLVELSEAKRAAAAGAFMLKQLAAD